MVDKVMSASCVWTPRVELSELPWGYVLKVELPGVRIEDIRVTVGSRLLMIAGGRRARPPDQAGRPALDVFGWTWALPTGINRPIINARFVDSTLIVRVPKEPHPSWEIEAWATVETVEGPLN